MYTITFPIPVYRQDERKFLLPIGLARDVLAQSKYVAHLRLICPAAAKRESLQDFQVVDLDLHPQLSFRLLPWDGGRKSFPRRYLAIKSVLAEEARKADTWHTGCSTGIWDLSWLSYQVGLRFAKGMRVVCLDSDPASMLSTSGNLSALKAPIVRSRYQRQLQESDAAIFVGSGAQDGYRRFAKRFVTTDAVWLQDGELADELQVRQKFSEIQPIRIALPSRLMPWKGIDDAINAFSAIGSSLPPWRLDIIGDGAEKRRLMELAARSSCPIEFRDPLPYGAEFLEALRTYHVLLAPTRGLEQTRIVFDALASGCILIHSRTDTLQNALAGFNQRWPFSPGNVASFKQAIIDCFRAKSRWPDDAIAGIQCMRGRTIDEMHRLRSEFFQEISTGAKQE